MLEPEELAEAFEREPAKQGLLAETRADDDEIQHSGKRRGVPDQELVGLVDRIGAEQRHHDRLHDELERDAEGDADGQGAHPAPGPDEAELAPRRVRPPSPHQHQERAERNEQQIAGEDDQDREDPERPESSQP